MCVTSMVGDFYTQKFEQLCPQFIPSVFPPTTGGTPGVAPDWATVLAPAPTRAEFDELKKMVLDMKELLIRAKIYDEKNNEPNCEMEDKVALLKRIAQLVGVDISKIV